MTLLDHQLSWGYCYLMNSASLKPAAVKFLTTLARCGEWHLRTTQPSSNLDMAKALVSDGLVALAHYYRRPSGGFAVYRLTAEGQRVVAADAETERLRKAIARRAHQAAANMNSAF